MSIPQWIAQNKLKTNKGQPIEFNQHRFLWDYLNDTANRIVVQKCTQVGISFTTELKILYLGDQDPISCVYTLPTGGDVKDFVLSKFDPVVEASESLKAKVKKDPFSRRAVYSTALKRIGDSHFFFRGSWSEHKAQAIDADVLVVDEVDFQKPDVRRMYEERLEGAGSKDIIYWLGIPSLPNYGISEIFEQSDQRQWHVKCPNCSQEQVLEFPRNISFQKKTYICYKCRKDLSDEVRKMGKWIPKYPGRVIHGYHFSRLMAPWITAGKIILSHQKDSARHFHNYTLGQAHIEETQKFKKEEFVKAAMQEQEYQGFKKQKIVVGIDQGNNFNLIAGFANSQESVVVNARLLGDTHKLEETLDLLKADLYVMDMFPDQHYARKLQEKYGVNKFLLINQRSWSMASKANEWMEFQRSKGIINLERTESIDRMMESIRNTAIRFLSSMSGLQEILLALQNLVPDLQERLGLKKRVYKTVGRDDYAHALNYFWTGCQIMYPGTGGRPSRIIPSSILEDFPKATGSWMKEDFEKTIRKLSSSKGTIHIPPKFL